MSDASDESRSTFAAASVGPARISCSMRAALPSSSIGAAM
jgi:hypothetical protein